MKQSGYNLRYALADRRGTGESRRFDAGAVDKVWSIRQLFNNEFMVVLMGAVSGEGRDYLTDRNGRHGASCCAADMVKSLAGGVGCLLIVVIVCGRADQRIAVNRRGYKNALAVFARQLEYRVPHMLPRRVGKQEVISPPGRDGHGVRRVAG